MRQGTPKAYLALRDKAMHRLCAGTAHDMRSVLSGIVWPSLRSHQVGSVLVPEEPFGFPDF
jgi:hypothetical protein